MDHIVIATRNPGKLEEFRALLSGLVASVRAASDFDAPEVIEDAPDLQGNALKKARALYDLTGLPSLGDDTGLEVTALNGAPGVHSARFAGPDCRPADNVAKLLRLLEPETDRSARFRTVLALVDGNGAQYFEGVCEGSIIQAPRGKAGFGYDPVFLPDGESATFAELPSARKNAISHRGQAMQRFRESLIGA